MEPFIMDHPLIQHKLTWLRDKNTGSKEFRELVSEIATLICYEATRDLPLEEVQIETPMGPAITKVISGRKLAFVPILRAGMGMLEGVLALLPAAKVAPHIQAIRGVPRTTLHSPPNHQGLYSIEESVQKMHLSLNAAFGFRVPVAIKCAASATSVSVYNNLLRDPYKICGGFFIDGIQGGTGAANEVSLDHTGHPVVSKLRDCYLAAVRQGLQGQIPLWAGGGIGMTGTAAADAFKMICLGANGVFLGKILIQLLGCVGNEQGRCNACSTGRCSV